LSKKIDILLKNNIWNNFKFKEQFNKQTHCFFKSLLTSKEGKF